MADSADQAQEYLEAAMRFYARRPKPIDSGPIRVSGIAAECADCGDDIDPARLKIFPHALRCAECQGYYEESITRG